MPNTTNPDTENPSQTPDESLFEEYNSDELAGHVDSGPDGTGLPSGSPSMEPDDSDWGNGDTLGNNDGTEPDPATTDEAN